MTNINRLSSQDTVNSNDLVPIWAARASDTRRITIGSLAAAIQALIQEATVAGITDDVTQNVETYLGTYVGASLVGFRQIGTGAVNRTVDSKLKESVTAEDFGAVGNGIADDSDALEKAMNSRSAYVRLNPLATYKITRAISIYTSNLVVDGQGATIQQATTNTSGIVVGQAIGGAYSKVENVFFVNLGLQGADDGQGSSYSVGVTVRPPATNPYARFDGCNNIRFEGCRFSGWSMSTAATAVTGLHFHKNLSKDTYFHQTLNAGGYGLLAQCCFDIFATENTFQSVAKSSPSTTTDRHAIYISSDPSRGFAADNVCKGVHIAGNVIDWRNVHPVTGVEACVALRSPESARIDGNLLYGGYQGIALNTENANCKGIVLSNNNLVDILTNGVSEQGALNIFLGSGANLASDVTISGNTITYSGAQASGIQVAGVVGCSVSGNSVKAAATVLSGIYVGPNCTDVMLAPNAISLAAGRGVFFAGTGTTRVTISRQQIYLAAGANRYSFTNVPALLRFDFLRTFQLTSNGAGSVTSTNGDESPVVSVASDASGFSVVFNGSVDVNAIGFSAIPQSSSVSAIYKRTTSANTIFFGVLNFAGAAMPAATNAYVLQLSIPY